MTELRKQINNIVEDYQECKVLAKSVGSTEVYEGTTATAGDIRLGKTAYSNGEKITGELQASDCNALIEPKNLKTATVLTMLRTISNLDVTNVTSLYNAFNGYQNLTAISFMNTSNLDNISRTFYGCTNLTEITGLDTSNVTNMSATFQNCTKLIELPEIDVSKLQYLQLAFSGCTSLSDESLNNILAMCANAVNYTQTKTLAYIGLTSAQATICTTLSNYQAFLDAGWITGF